MERDYKESKKNCNLRAVSPQVIKEKVFVMNTKRLRIFYLKILNQCLSISAKLLQLNYSTSCLDGLLEVLSLVLRKTFLQC